MCLNLSQSYTGSRCKHNDRKAQICHLLSTMHSIVVIVPADVRTTSLESTNWSP
jgi:hypothetical protein